MKLAYRNILWVMAVLGMMALSVKSEIRTGFYDDTFDLVTEIAGQSPGQGWERYAQSSTGSYVLVTASNPITGPNCLELHTEGMYTSSPCCGSLIRRKDLAPCMDKTKNIYCSFDVKITSNSNQQFRFCITDANYAQIGWMQLRVTGGAFYAQYGLTQIAQALVNSFVANQWYHVQFIFSPSLNKYSITVYANGAIVGQLKDLPSLFPADKQPAGMLFISDGATVSPAVPVSVYLDNITVASVPCTDLSFDTTAVGTVPALWGCTAQSSTGSSVLVRASPGGRSGNSLELKTYGPGNTAPIGCSSAILNGYGAFQPNSTQDYASFDIYLTDTTTEQFRMTWRNAAGSGLGNMQIVLGGNQIKAQYGLTSVQQQVVSTFSANQWYTIQLTHTPGVDAYNITVSSPTSGVIGSLSNLPNTFSRELEGISLMLDGKLTGSVSAYIDNVIVQNAVHVPKTYYLSSAGADSNAGFLASPWKTFAYACKYLRPGDTLIAQDGTYCESGISYLTQAYGMAIASRPIMIKSQNPLGAVFYGVNNQWAKINIGQNYVTVRDMEITQDAPHTPVAPATANCDYFISVGSGGNHCSILNNKMHGAYENCIKAYRADNLLIAGNQIYDTSHEGIDTVNCFNLTVCDNEVWNISRSAMVAKGGARGARFYNNYIHTGSKSMSYGIQLGGMTDYASGTLVYDPSGYECYYSAAYNNLIVADSPGQLQTAILVEGAINCSAIYNIVSGANVGINIQYAPDLNAGFGWNWNAPSTNTLVANNIFQNCTYALTTLNATNTTMDYNLFYNCTNSVPLQAHGSTANPMFDSTWHLLGGSPGRGVANNYTIYDFGIDGIDKKAVDLTRDADGNLRSNPSDLGIYQN